MKEKPNKNTGQGTQRNMEECSRKYHNDIYGNMYSFVFLSSIIINIFYMNVRYYWIFDFIESIPPRMLSSTVELKGQSDNRKLIFRRFDEFKYEI